jgi:hypothetical protein
MVWYGMCGCTDRKSVLRHVVVTQTHEQGRKKPWSTQQPNVTRPRLINLFVTLYRVVHCRAVGLYEFEELCGASFVIC